MPLKTTAGNHGEAVKGRGATINIEGRFEKWAREQADDGWFQVQADDEPARPQTTVSIERVKTIITRNDSPDLGFDRSINPYRGCEHGCSYCMSGDTPILAGDGRTKPMSELRVGELVYGTKRVGQFRRYARSRVLAHWSSIKPAYRTTLEDGTELVTSGDHRFLTERGWKHVSNTDAGPRQRAHLTTNNSLLGTGAYSEGPSDSDEYRRGYLCGMLRGDGSLCDPEALLRSQDYLLDFGIATQEWQFLAANDRHRAAHAIGTRAVNKWYAIEELIRWPSAPGADWTLGFLAGVFDAEGSFSQTVWQIGNTDPEIIAWIESCLDRFGFSYVVEHTHHTTKKPIDHVRLKGGLREYLRFFHLTCPAITRKLNLEGQAIKSDAKLRVVSVEPLGKVMRLYDITTETEDFIANGVVSHNCYARPSHGYLGLSPGLDFETRLFAKTNAAERLREELARPGYRVDPVAIGVNTDAYQPIEREYKITRSVFEVLSETHHPSFIITKSALIERDIDILASLAQRNLLGVTITLVTLDQDISRYLEPRTSAPARRLKAIETLARAGIPVNVNIAPVIPFLTDSELETIMEAVANAGARSAAYTLLRLPWAVKDIFRAWLEAHFPLKAAHVMSRVREMRGGKENDPSFGSRMHGQGEFGQLLSQRYKKGIARFKLDAPWPELDCTRFTPPSMSGQGKLF